MEGGAHKNTLTGTVVGVMAEFVVMRIKTADAQEAASISDFVSRVCAPWNERWVSQSGWRLPAWNCVGFTYNRAGAHGAKLYTEFEVCSTAEYATHACALPSHWTMDIAERTVRSEGEVSSFRSAAWRWTALGLSEEMCFGLLASSRAKDDCCGAVVKAVPVWTVDMGRTLAFV